MQPSKRLTAIARFPARFPTWLAALLIAVAAGPTIALAGGSSAASNEVRAAQREIARVITDLRRDFEASAALRDARSAAAQAMANYRAVSNETINKLQSDAAYRRASVNVELAERRLAAVRVAYLTDRQVTSKTLETIARELLDARVAESKLEAAALKNNPDVEQARYACMDANAAVLGLQRDFNRSIQSSSEFAQARARLDAARRQLSIRAR